MSPPSPRIRTVLLFANPVAGRGKGQTIARRLADGLQQRGYDPILCLRRPDAFNGLPQSAPIHAAIVIGGDGTLRGVAQWAIDTAMSSGAERIPYPLLIVPMGTANLMGQHLGIAWDDARLVEQVAAALDRPRILHLDVARASDRGIFLLMAGVGIDAWIVHELSRIRTGPIGKITYIAPALRALATYRFPELSVSVDGRLVWNNEPALVMVGNVPEYGAGFPILPYARSNDQTLDICVMPCRSQLDLASLFIAAAAGQHLAIERVVYLKGRHIRIDSPHPIPVQLDGEAAAFTPLSIDLLPTRIPFIVPGVP